MPTSTNMLTRLSIILAIAAAVYALILASLLTPSLQRFALYAHKIQDYGWLHDVDNPEQVGFGKGQVHPFRIQTPDGESLYAWHVLPLDVYARFEGELREVEVVDGEGKGKVDEGLAFRLLAGSQDAKVVVNFHGNAGHVAQGWRTDTYRYLAAQPNTHVLTIDYRGFGKSTGEPTEAGLIIDGIALVDWVIHTAKIPQDRIVILGQSLGTAVASAVALKFADPSSTLIPRLNSIRLNKQPPSSVSPVPTLFAGIILVAPFSSIPNLMLTYRLGGFVPLLLPLKPFPALAELLTARMTEKWPTADRLRAYYEGLADSKALVITRDDMSGDGSRTSKMMGGLSILHAVDDGDISFRQTGIICRRIFAEQEEGCDGVLGESVGSMEVHKTGRPRVRIEVVGHGGETIPTA